jgi:hypothetical protein
MAGWKRMENELKIFPATLARKEKLITYLVGFGVGMGVPTVLGISFALGFQEPWLLLFPLPFVLAFGAPYFFRPLGFVVANDAIIILRPLGSRRIQLETLQEIRVPAMHPPGMTIGLMRVQGLYGTFGSFWNKHWGKFRVYVTNQANTVELGLTNGSRIIISPDDPQAFVQAVRNLATFHNLNVRTFQA